MKESSVSAKVGGILNGLIANDQFDAGSNREVKSSSLSAPSITIIRWRP